MIDGINVQRFVGDGRYGDVLDVAEYLGNGDLGSAVNALCVMARQSDLYRQAIAEIENIHAAETRQRWNESVSSPVAEPPSGD